MLFVWAFAVWTVFVWGNRIRNILADDGSAASLAVAIALTAMGVAVALVAATGWRRAQVVAVAFLVTILVWAVRVPIILLDGDHSAGFKAVHTGLAVVSIVLGALALRGAGGERSAGVSG